MIDFHSHVLPEMDDGSKNMEMSMAMLSEMHKQGVTTCVATPHFYAYRQNFDSFIQRREKAAEALRAQWNVSPEILIGAEVAFCSALADFSARQLDALCIEGTHLLMIEMPFTQWAGEEVDTLSHLCLDRGYTIILAHIERFIPLQSNKTALNHIWQLPLYAQINAECLLSVWQRRPYLKMLQENSAHLLGSDCHNMSARSPNLLAARKVVENKLGKQVLYRVDQCGEHLLHPTAI